MLHNMAVDPTSDAWSSTTAEAAAWLSFRELVSPISPLLGPSDSCIGAETADCRPLG